MNDYEKETRKSEERRQQEKEEKTRKNEIVSIREMKIKEWK